MYNTIATYGVDKDGNKTLLYELPTVAGLPTPTPQPDPLPDEGIPIAGVVKVNGLRVRNIPSTAGSEVMGEFKAGDQAWFEDKTYYPSTDSNEWIKIVKINGNVDDIRVGGFVAKQYVDLSESKPVPKA